MMAIDEVPFSDQWSFWLGNGVFPESWGIHGSFSRNDDHTRKWSQNDFEFGSMIGNGGFGKVFRARLRRPMLCLWSEQEFAMKLISKESVIEREKRGKRAILLLLRETNIQSHLDHEHIIRLFGFYETESSFSFVMELAYHKDVLSYLYEHDAKGHRRDDSLIRRILVQTSRALAYLEHSLVAHRDIKPENIVLDQNLDAKLTDFGWAVWCRPNRMQTTFCGTAEYCPPEIAKKGNLCYDPRFVDRWMLGVLIVELTTGATPFKPKDADDDYYDVLALNLVQNFTATNRLKLPPDVHDLVAKLLIVDPPSRKSAAWVCAHPFFGVNEIPPTSSPTVAQRRQLFQSIDYH